MLATLDQFREHGFVDLGRVIDSTVRAALLPEIRPRRRLDADMFSTDRAFPAALGDCHLRLQRLPDAPGPAILVIELSCRH